MTNMIWGPIPRRNLTENEEWQLIKLLTTLQNVPIHEGEDTRMWEASKYCFFFFGQEVTGLNVNGLLYGK